MTMEQVEQSVKTLLAVAFAIFLVCGSFRFILMEFRLHRRDKSPVQTAPALAYFKHPDMKPVLAGRSSTYVYYVTFHTDSGESVKLYLNPGQFHSIEEGSRGILTWQGDRFWKFEQEVSA